MMQSFELEKILDFYQESKRKGLQTVMASLVGLEGSSYRKPGVRMLFNQQGAMMGAISGGCVEKEIFRQANEVFDTGESKIISYDGRYRLGCEGFLYVLIEVFSPAKEQVADIQYALMHRKLIKIDSYYQEQTQITGSFGSVFYLDETSFTVSPYSENDLITNASKLFKQQVKLSIRLILIGSGHDAQTLSKVASEMGWDVHVLCSPQSNTKIVDFPGVKSVVPTIPGQFTAEFIDQRTAIVLMNHNFAKDLRYLLTLSKLHPLYVGLVGSVKRWNRLQEEMFEADTNLNLDFLDKVRSPAGLDMGSETAQEISLSIISEIQAVFSGKLHYPIRPLSESKIKEVAV